MLKEMMEYLHERAEAYSRPREIELNDPRRYFFSAGSSIQVYERQYPVRSHIVHHIDSLVALAIRFADRKPAIWVSPSHVVLVIDDQTHRLETAVMQLDRTDPFIRLAKLNESVTWMSLRDFVNLLRVDLVNTMESSILLDRVRRLKFDCGQVVSAESIKHRESIGKTVVNKVSADVEIPDEVQLTLPVFYNTQAIQIVCSIDIDPTRAVLALKPFPDQINLALRSAVAQIAANINKVVNDRLDEGVQPVPVYIGKP